MTKKKKKKKWDVRKMSDADIQKFLGSESYKQTTNEGQTKAIPKSVSKDLPNFGSLLTTKHGDYSKPFQKKETVTPTMKKFGGTKTSEYNPAESFAKSFVSDKKTQNKITKDIEKDYYKISSYKPNISINNWVKSDTNPITFAEKMGQKAFGLKGSVASIKDIKPKVVYQTQEDVHAGSTIKNKGLKKEVMERPIKLVVIGEDKENYYYRDADTGELNSVSKEDASENKPNLTEHKRQYMEYVVKSNKDVTSFMDKAIKSGVTTVEKLAKPVTGLKVPKQVPLIGGQSVGGLAEGGFEFAKEMAGAGPISAGGGGLMKASEEFAEKGVSKAAQLLASKGGKVGSKIASKLESGVVGAAAKGAGFMVPYEGLKATGGEDVRAEDIVAGAAFGTIFHLGGKAVSKSLSKIKDRKVLRQINDEMEVDAENINKIQDPTEKAKATEEARNKYVIRIEETYKGKKFTEKVEEPSNVEKPPSNETELPSNVEKPPSSKEELTTQLKKYEDDRLTYEKQGVDVDERIEEIKMQLEQYESGRMEENVNPPIEEEPPLKEAEYDIMKHVKYKEEKAGKLKKLPKEIYKKTFDKFNRIYDFTKKASNLEKKTVEKLTAIENPYKLAQIAGNYDVVAKSTIEQAVRDKTGKVVGDSLAKIIKEIPKGKNEEFQNYLVAKRAYDLMSEEKIVVKKIKGKKGKLDRTVEETVPAPRKVYPDMKGAKLEDVKAKIAEVEAANPNYVELQKKFVKYNRDISKTLLVDSGMLSKKQWQDLIIDHPNYVPLYRVFEEAEAAGMGGQKSGFVNVNNQIKKLEGSERQVHNVYTNMIENTFNYAKAAKRNEVGQVIYKWIEKNPEALKGFAEIVQKSEPTANKTIKEGDLISFLEDFNNAYDVKEVKKLNKANIVRVRIDGETKHLQINDLDFLKAITNLSVDNMNGLLDGMRRSTNIMKVLTTGNNPMFGILRNIWRDIPTSFIFSKTTSKIPVYNLAKFSVEMGQAAFDIVAGKGTYKEYKSQGGGFINSIITSSSKEMLQKASMKLSERKFKATDIATKPFKAAWTAAEWANNILETLPRYREYKTSMKQLTKKGLTSEAARSESMYRASDVTVNFRRSGEWAKAADTFVPYLNAALQGLDKFVREFNPKSKTPAEYADLTAKAIQVVTLPSLFLYFVADNRNDENYLKLSSYIKDNNFCIPAKWFGGDEDKFIKIPKPREIGILFGGVPELLYEKLEYDNPKAFNRFLEALKTNFIPPNPLTQNIAMPIARNVLVKEGATWRGTPVVNQGLLKRPAELQYDENTSEIAKVVGDVFNFAPKKVDDILKSYFGGVAQLGIPLTSERAKNTIKEQKGNRVVKNAKGAIKVVIESLKKQAIADSKYSTDIINDFYVNVEQATNDKAELTFKNKLKGEDETYVDRANYVFNKANTYITELNKKQKKVKTNKEKDAIQKKKTDFMLKLNQDYMENYKNKENMTTFKRENEFRRPKN